MSYAAAVKGPSMFADVSLKLHPVKERKMVMARIPVKRNVSDESLIEQSIDVTAKKTRISKEHFRSELSRTDSLVTIDVIPVQSNFPWCMNYDLLTDRLTKLENERLRDKENALLRQIALDIERAIKIAIMDNMPELKQKCFNKRRGVWNDSEVGCTQLETLWYDAEEIEGLYQQILSQFSLHDVDEFDRLLNELKGIKNLFDSTAHPNTQPDGQPVDKAYRLSLLAKHAMGLSDCRVVQRLAQTTL